MLRRSLLQQSSSTTRRSKRECVVFLIHKQYEGNVHVDQPLDCELQGEDLYGKKYKMVRVKGLTTSWALKNNVTSGVTTIFSPEGGVIDDQANELVIPYGTVIKVRISCMIGSYLECSARCFMTSPKSWSHMAINITVRSS